MPFGSHANGCGLVRERGHFPPGYSLTRLALVAAGAKVRPIPVDQYGINVAEGIRRAPKARAVFITPSHQFPKGIVLSMARRLELLAWARERGAWIVEDDYASEFRYGGRPLASLQSLDEAERVIYIGTLSDELNLIKCLPFCSRKRKSAGRSVISEKRHGTKPLAR